MSLKYLKKAITTSSTFEGGSYGGFLSPQQVKQFLRMAIEASVLLREIRQEFNIAPKFEVPRLSLNSRLLVPGTQGARVAEGSRKVPVSGLMSLSTVLFKGEVPIADEAFEDQIERAGFADTLATMIAEAVGRDVEELAIKSDTARDPLGTDVGEADSDNFDEFDGLIKRSQAVIPSAQKLDAAAITTYEDLFDSMISKMMPRYRRDYSKMRLYVSTEVRDGYQKSLSERGTSLGDQALISRMASNLGYRGIPVVEIPLLSGTDTINGTAIDYSKFAWLTDPKNFVIGFQRKVRMEKYRDPREGATSFLPTVRFDVDIANPEASVLAYNVDIAV